MVNGSPQGIINQPAGMIRAEVDGQAGAFAGGVGDPVKLGAVEKQRPATVGDLGQATLRELLSVQSILNTAKILCCRLFVLRRAGGGSTAVVQVGALSLRADDVLVWANASGRVVDLPLVVGEACVAGEALAELHSAHTGGLFHYIQLGILLELFPPLIFLGVGALTDFGPLVGHESANFGC